MYSVAYSPDGQQIVSVSFDKSIRIWDANSGACLAILAGHTDGVRAVAYSPDGRRIASGSVDKTVRLWDAQTGAILSCWQGHDDAVLSVAFSPCGEWVASGGRDRTARIWDVATGRQLRCFRGHDRAVLCVAFSPAGRQLASGTGDQSHSFDGNPLKPDGMVRLWDITTGEQVCNYCVPNHEASHLHPVGNLAFSPDGSTLAASFGGSFRKVVCVWDTATGHRKWCIGDRGFGQGGSEECHGLGSFL